MYDWSLEKFYAFPRRAWGRTGATPPGRRWRILAFPAARDFCSRNLAGTFWLCVLVIFGFAAGLRAQTAPSEYQIKAAFLYNFAKFIEWPDQVFASPKAPFVIGVLGKNVFGNVLEQTILNKSVDNHAFEVRMISSPLEATNCQILFISPSEMAHVPEILSRLKGRSTLTVSESAGFCEAGGMVNFVLEDNRVHFQINEAAAKQAQLKISSKLLSLAVHPAH